MNTLLERRFAAIGARVRLAPGPWRGAPAIDVRADADGEYFDIDFRGGDAAVEVEVVDARPRDRHLLLLVRQEAEKSKFLCGHDERHWFVAAVPEAARGVTGVDAAKDALQPAAVRRLVDLAKPKDRFRRRNPVYVRQGEWFFVPAPRLVVDGRLVALNEPLSRGGGSKPHTCQFAFRTGGFGVLACHKYPQGVSEAAYRRLLAEKPEAGRWNWHRMVRDPQLYVRGRVWHRDHKTVVLDGWHRVVMNTEGEAPGLGRVVFLD